MLGGLLVVVLIGASSGCQTGYGNDALLETNPTFRFSFYPPIAWTYYSGVPPAGVTDGTVFPPQASSSTEATNKMNTDIAAAIERAASQYGRSAAGSTYLLTGYTPFDCLIRKDGAAGNRPVGTCNTEIGAVTARRIEADNDQGISLLQNGILRVTTSQLLTRGQWKTIATAAYNQLTMNAKVYFTTPIELI